MIDQDDGSAGPRFSRHPSENPRLLEKYIQPTDDGAYVWTSGENGESVFQFIERIGRVEDRRGKHTKASRAEAARKKAEETKQPRPPPAYSRAACPCAGYHGGYWNDGVFCCYMCVTPYRGQCDCIRPPVHVVHHHDGSDICEDCGTVLSRHRALTLDVYTPAGELDQFHNIVHAYEQRPLLPRAPRQSAPYYSPYHLNERLAQWTNREPRIPFPHLEVLAQLFEEHTDGTLTPPPKSAIRWCTRHLGERLRRLDPGLPASIDDAYHKKYGERWVQIWAYLAGDRDSLAPLEMLGYEFPNRVVLDLIRQLAVVFYEQYVRCHGGKLFRGRHNIPYLDAVTTQLLLQLDRQLAVRLGWHFRQLRTTACRVNSEKRIETVICAIAARAPVMYFTSYNRHVRVEWKYYSLLLPSDLL